MPDRRAYRLTLDHQEVGFVGEGEGPFIAQSSSELGHPQLPHARYTATSALGEEEIADILVSADSFDEALARLKERGFGMRSITYDAVFLPAQRTGAVGAPDREAESRRRREEL